MAVCKSSDEVLGALLCGLEQEDALALKRSEVQRAQIHAYHAAPWTCSCVVELDMTDHFVARDMGGMRQRSKTPRKTACLEGDSGPFVLRNNPLPTTPAATVGCTPPVTGGYKGCSRFGVQRICVRLCVCGVSTRSPGLSIEEPADLTEPPRRSLRIAQLAPSASAASRCSSTSP